jgi:hypothetical protein
MNYKSHRDARTGGSIHAMNEVDMWHPLHLATLAYGYCIDAPEMVPAGSTVKRNYYMSSDTYTEPSIARRSMRVTKDSLSRGNDLT